MAVDPRIEPLVSPLAETLFPDAYRESAPRLVSFMRAYLLWAEQQGYLAHSRRLLDYHDVDLVPDALLSHLRAKYLDGVPLTDAADVRMIIKHVLDVLRSRGSPRGLDLFFRLAYGAGAQVYYPSTDLLRTSTGRWLVPRWLEVWSPAGSIAGYVGREIEGKSSGARAFVERAFRKNVRGKLVDSLAISALEGHFSTGESIDFANSSSTLVSTVVGSLTTLDIIDGAGGLEVGDSLALEGGSGTGGAATVAATAFASGFVEFSLLDGGYAYTANALTLLSANTVQMEGVSVDSATNPTNNYVRFLEVLSQPVKNVGYQAATATPVRGDLVNFYTAAPALVASGCVLSVAASNSTAGQVVISIYSGNTATANTVKKQGNTYTANVMTQDDQSASGRVVSEGDAVLFQVTGNARPFTVGENIYQATPAARGVIEKQFDGTLQVFDRVGVFTTGASVTSDSGVAATTSNLVVNAAVDTLSGLFAADELARVFALASNTRAAGVLSVSTGTGAAWSISAIDDTEVVTLITDYVNPLTGVVINAATYGFVTFPSANLATFLANAFATNSFTIGRVAGVRTDSPGTGYNSSPSARAWEPVTYFYGKQGWRVPLAGATAPFAVGELVSQSATGARGFVVDSNTSVVTLRRASLLRELVPTVNSTTTLSGALSGATANAVAIWRDPADRPLDTDATISGADATVNADATTTTGTADSVAVSDSGFGYLDGDVVSFTAPDGSIGAAIVRLGSEGFGPGRYSTTPGATSANKHLWDGRYWQEMSYEIQSSVAPSAYDLAVARFQHVTGTARFDKFKWSSTANASTRAAGGQVEQS